MSKPKTFVVLMNNGEVHGGTDSLIVHRKDKVMFANASERTCTITWKKNKLNANGCPFEWDDDEAVQHVRHGQPLMLRVDDEKSAPCGRYCYKVRVKAEGKARAAGWGAGDGGGGGEIIIQP